MCSKYVCLDSEVEVPIHLNFGNFLLNKLKKGKENVALVNSKTNEQLTYDEILHLSVNMARALKKIGVTKDDTVALGCEKRNDFIAIVLAVIFTGATFTPIDVYSGKAVVSHKLSLSRPKFFIISKQFWDANKYAIETLDFIETYISIDQDLVHGVPIMDYVSNDPVEEFQPTDVLGQIDTAIMLYSSGTTGMPKGVKITHLDCIDRSLSNPIFDANTIKTVWIYGEWYHNYDLFMTFKFLTLGKRIVYQPTYFEEEMLQVLQHYQVNMAMLVPSSFAYLSKVENIERFKMESLKILYCRSAPLRAEILEKVLKSFPHVTNVYQGYGLTELGEPTSEVWGDKGAKSGSVGKAAPGVIIKISDLKTEEVLGTRETGEVRIKSAATNTDIYSSVDRTMYLDDEGFFKTGDIGYFDDDEYLFIVGRYKEIISYDGYKISPVELESVLLSHQGVKDVGVVGIPDPDKGEVPVAFIEKQPGSSVTEQELKDFVFDQVAHYMYLRGGVRFIDKIPRNYRGKILRHVLKAIL